MTSCSLGSLGVDEPLAGTAPQARAWIVVEQPGPWGRDALTDSHLDPAVGAFLSSAKGTGVVALLARHPNRTEREAAPARNVWVARSVPGGMRMRHGLMADVRDLLAWDLDAIGTGQLPAFGVASSDPLLLVCTHSGRDRCCAVHGRALAADLYAGVDATDRARIWECSHIGGHRFAPVTLTLPSGAVHGRLQQGEGLDVWQRSAGGRVLPGRLRGRTCFPQPHQVAAIDVMNLIGSDGVDELDVLCVIDGRVVPMPRADIGDARNLEVEVRHFDGRSWRVDLQRDALSADRPESCGGEPVTGWSWTSTRVIPADPWA